MRKLSYLFFFLLIFLLSTSTPIFLLATPAKADTLIIQNDKEVLLVADDNVLGVFITDSKANSSKPNTPPSPPQPSKSQAPANPPSSSKSIPIVPPNTPSVIQTSPSPGKTDKLQVTIKTQQVAVQPTNPTSTSPTSANQPAVTALPNSANSPSIPAVKTSPTPNLPTPSSSPNTSANTTTINKDVNKVILEGTTNQAVLTIKSNQNAQNSQILQQGATEISTSLPLQIDTKTNSISAVLASGSTKLNVLPNQAVEGVVSQGLINNTQNNQPAEKISLEEDQNQPVYKIQGQKSGKLLGIFPVSSPVEVKISAQTGTVTGVNQSVLFQLFGAFVKS